MAFKQILIDFCGWTTASGIPHIGSSQSPFLKIFWTVVFILSTGGFCYYFYEIIHKFLSYGVTVATELKFEQRDFPAVTVCNLNPFKGTDLSDIPEVQWLISNYTSAMQRQPVPGNPWGFDELKNNTISIRGRAQEHLMFLSASLRKYNESVFNKTTYAVSELISNCAYNTKPCSLESDFNVTTDPIYGDCFTFNNKVPVTYQSSRAGPLYGLRLLIKNNQSEYLPIIDSAAVRVAVHAQGQQPFMDAFGFNAPAGSATSFGVKFVEIERKSAPYGDCAAGASEETYFYTGPYSTEGCYRSCIQKNIVDDCKCADPRFASRIDTYCTTKDINCVEKYTTTSARFNPMAKCSCVQPCSEGTYSVTLSTSRWPSDVYQAPDCLKSKTTSSWSTSKECSEWYHRHTMIVEVFYERMNYQMLSEKESYGFIMLLSDLGGQIGMWTGVSFITIVEIIALGVVLGLYCIHRKDRVKIIKDADDTDDEEQEEEEDEEEEEEGKKGKK